jgi:hypothetical protein
MRKIKFRWPIYFAEMQWGDSSTVQVLCYHCGKLYITHPDNLRVPNYCNNCR